MAGKRTYDDPCGVARALEVVGERWALLVVRELLRGPKRFTELSRGLPAMSQNVLSQRLRELEVTEVVRHRTLGPPTSARAYELTERGRGLEPVLVALSRWGSRTPMTSSADLSIDALVLALDVTFDPGAAGNLRSRLELRLGPDAFRAEVADGRFEITRGTVADPDVVIETDAATLRAVVFGGRSDADAATAGDLLVSGDRRAARRFLACFPPPTPWD